MISLKLFKEQFQFKIPLKKKTNITTISTTTTKTQHNPNFKKYKYPLLENSALWPMRLNQWPILGGEFWRMPLDLYHSEYTDRSLCPVFEIDRMFVHGYK